MRPEFKIGFLFYALTMLFQSFLPVPEFIMGFCLGISICFELIAILPEKTYQKIKEIKKFKKSKKV